MTEQPPGGNAPDDAPFEDPWHDQIVEAGETFGAPEVQSLVAFVLAVLCLGGRGLVQGGNYLFISLSAESDLKTRNIVSAVLSAAFTLLPIVLGWRVSARVLATDPRWVAALARAAVILGLLALVLDLVLAVLAAGAQDPQAHFNSF